MQTIRETLDNVAHGPLCGLDACPGCEATAALDSLAAALREKDEALREIVRRHPRGCGVIHSSRPKGWTCLDEQRRAHDEPNQYVKEYGDDVRAGKRRCDVCIARAALAAASTEGDEAWVNAPKPRMTTDPLHGPHPIYDCPASTEGAE